MLHASCFMRRFKGVHEQSASPTPNVIGDAVNVADAFGKVGLCIRPPPLAPRKLESSMAVWTNARHVKVNSGVSPTAVGQAQHDTVAVCWDLCGPCQAAASTPLFVHPNVFHPPIIVDAVDLLHDPDDVWLPAGSAAIVHDDWPRSILLQLAVNLPYQL